jgi:hypothetical protein
MAEASDKQKDIAPRVYTVKEAFKKLDIGVTAGREWIVLYERLTAPLPRATDKPNGARLVTLEAIKTIRSARSVIAQSGGGITSEDAMRRVLGLDPLPIQEHPVEPELTPAAFAAAVKTELEPLLQRLASLESEVHGLRSELAASKALPPAVDTQPQQQNSPRPNTFFNRLKNVFGRGESG